MCECVHLLGGACACECAVILGGVRVSVYSGGDLGRACVRMYSEGMHICVHSGSALGSMRVIMYSESELRGVCQSVRRLSVFGKYVWCVRVSLCVSV